MNNNKLNKENIRKDIHYIIEDVFQKIKNGSLERAWEVYDEFNNQLNKFINKL